MPYCPLKRRSAGFDRQVVYRSQFPRKVEADGARQVIWIVHRFEPEAVPTVLKSQRTIHAILMFRPIGGAQVSRLISHDQHLADRRVKPVHEQLQDLIHVSVSIFNSILSLM